MLCYRCGHYAPDGSTKCPACGQVFSRQGSGDGTRRTSSQRAPQAIFSIGETVAERYRILDVVGSGGVGAVYRAHDTDIDVEVALKAVAPKLLQTPDEQKTFSKFVKTARKLHHANIVRIYDEGRDMGPQGERRFFTMQLLEGLTLRKIIQLRREKGQVFTLQEVEPIFAQLAAALDYAHKSVWHGDLKPENVLVLPDLLKVTDFCLIQALPTKPFLAIQKSRGYSYHYISPEVRLEASRIDGRADVYSMGVMLAEMLTGEMYEGHQSKTFHESIQGLAKPVEQLILHATHESPDARLQSAGELAEGISRLARGDLAMVQTEFSTPRSMPPPPPIDSGVHDSPDMSQQADSSIPELSASSVMMIEEMRGPGSTDVTEVPEELLRASDETPVVGLTARRVAGVLEIDTDEQSPRAKGQAGSESPPPLHGPPRHEDTDLEDPHESATAPGLLQDVENAARANGHGGNGRPDPLGPPPPLPEDASDSGRMAVSTGDMSIHDEPTLAEKGSGQVPIYDALTSLRPHPTRPPSMPAVPLSIPPAERPNLSLPPPPVAMPPVPPGGAERRPERRPFPPFLLFVLIGLVVGVCGYFVFRYIRDLENRVQQQQMQLPTEVPPQPPIAASPSSGPPPEGVEVQDDEQRKLQEAQAQAAAEKKQQEERQAQEERAAAQARREQEEEAKARREEAAAAKRTPPDDSRRAEADRRRQEAEERKREQDEARRAEADRRRNEAEERKRAADEARRAEAERKKAEAEEKKRQAEAKKKELASVVAEPAKLKCKRGMAMVAAGTFRMGSAGSDPMHNFEEKRLEEINVPAFCMDYYEYPNSKSAKPTTNVSWFQAQELCKRKGKRLCAEEEWEKACKGSALLRFPYGNTWDPDRCNTQDAEGNDRELAEQKAFPKCRSGYGLINLSGNASEWTSAQFSASNKDRVHKGGSANRPDWAVRCANRANLSASGKNPFVGFRCCADPTAAP